jgi:Protein of unknown function (DUF2939)
MNRLQQRLLAAAAIAIAAGIAAYWYWSPYLAVRALREAALNADAARFNEHVDFPRVRDSLKAQFAERIDGAGGRSAGGFGGLLANAVIGTVIDAAVRPETIMFAMREGRFNIERGGQREDQPQSEPGERKQPVWRTERQGVDTVLFHVQRDGGDGSDRMALVMQRHGFADWKLTDIRLSD